MASSAMSTSAATTGKRKRVSSVTSGPGESSQSRGQSSWMNYPARGLPAGQYAAVHYTRPRRSGGSDVHELGIFSITENRSWYDVPRFPFDGGIRSGCQCTSLAGKIYVLGGVMEGHVASGDVFVYDLMTNEWARRASMLHPRLNFGVGVLHGKIYAFGGRNRRESVVQCEKYDPEINSWLDVCDILEARVNPQIAAVGEELLVFGGQVLDTDYLIPQIGRYRDREPETLFDSVLDGALLDEPVGDSDDLFPSTIMCYHPVANTWRWIETDRGQHWSDSVFLSHRRFYLLTRFGISGSDDDGVTWSRSYRFRVAEELTYWDMVPKLGCRTLLLNGELWIVSHGPPEIEAFLLRTRGFSNRNNVQIALELGPCSLGKFDEGSTIVFPLDL